MAKFIRVNGKVYNADRIKEIHDRSYDGSYVIMVFWKGEGFVVTNAFHEIADLKAFMQLETGYAAQLAAKEKADV